MLGPTVQAHQRSYRVSAEGLICGLDTDRSVHKTPVEDHSMSSVPDSFWNEKNTETETLPLVWLLEGHVS